MHAIPGFTAADMPTNDELAVILRVPSLAEASERSATRREREMRSEEEAYQRSLECEHEAHRKRLAQIEAYHAKRRADLFGEHENRVDAIVNGMAAAMRRGFPFKSRYWVNA